MWEQTSQEAPIRAGSTSFWRKDAGKGFREMLRDSRTAEYMQRSGQLLRQEIAIQLKRDSRVFSDQSGLRNGERRN
jgi:hypothetical protein